MATLEPDKLLRELANDICQGNYSATEVKVLFALVLMTWFVQANDVVITTDDLRYKTGEKLYLLEGALIRLIQRNVLRLRNTEDARLHVTILGDSRRWTHTLPKNGDPNTKVLAEYIYNSNTLEVNSTIPLVRGLPKNGNRTPPSMFLDWMLADLDLHPSQSQWRIEHGKAVKLYTEALNLAVVPKVAMLALRDYYLDMADERFRQKVKMPMSYLAEGFRRWYKAIPPKPRRVTLNEELTGYRYRYSIDKKGWYRTDERI